MSRFWSTSCTWEEGGVTVYGVIAKNLQSRVYSGGTSLEGTGGSRRVDFRSDLWVFLFWL